MKYLFILILTTCLIACKKPAAKVSPFIPGEYMVPENDREQGITYVYQDKLTNELSYHDHYYIRENGNKYLVTRTYNGDGITQDSVLEYNELIRENYSKFFSGPLIKGVIKRDTVIKDGSRFGKRITESYFPHDTMTVNCVLISKFLKDTVFIWYGTKRPTLVMSNDYTFQLVPVYKNIGEPITYTMTAYSYHAAGMGIVRIRLYDINRHQEKNLDLFKIQNLVSK